jgi:Tol biopolymer transport system component
MKTRYHVTARFLTLPCLFIIVFVLNPPQLKQPPSAGRLVFTDYRPNGGYTVDIFDLDQNTRSSLPREVYDDIGYLSPVDNQHMLVTACFAWNNPIFCSGYFTDIVTSEEVQRLDVVKPVWEENYGPPVWSPDGTYIAFIVSSRGTESDPLYHGDTYVMKADGTELLDLTPDEDNNGFSFTWSPDSQRLAFACNREKSLCIANADGSDLQKSNAPENTKVRDVTWSPDGTQIALSLLDSDNRNSQINVVNADGTNIHPLLEAGTNYHESPVWSPDSSRIAFRSGEQGNNVGEIYVMDRNGTNLHNLSQSLDGNEIEPVWSPDSTRLAFFSHQYGAGHMYLYVVQADGSNLQQLTDNHTWENFDAGSPALFWFP